MEINKLIKDKIKYKYVIRDESTFLIGNTVEYFLQAETLKEVKAGIEFAKKKNLPIVVLGRGSDVLFSNEHLKMMVIKVSLDYIKKEDEGLYKVGAGSILNKFIFKITQDGWAGMEKLIGIPGSVGGGIWANAGAYGVEIKNFVKSVKVIWLDNDEVEIKNLSNEDCLFSYRDSIFKHRKGVILEAEFEFKEKVVSWEKSKKEILEILKSRQEKHPLDYPNAGSIFKNVIVNDEIQELLGTDFAYNKIPAGWLIEQVGLKGYKIGNAQFSEKHANFIINLGGATAQDVLELIELAKVKVKDKYGIELQEELIYIAN